MQKKGLLALGIILNLVGPPGWATTQPAMQGEHAERFYIQVEELAPALTEYSRQAELQVLFDYELIASVHVNKVDCICTRTEALNLILYNTGIIFDSINDHTLAFSPLPTWNQQGIAVAVRGYPLGSKGYGLDMEVTPNVKTYTEYPGEAPGLVVQN